MAKGNKGLFTRIEKWLRKGMGKNGGKKDPPERTSTPTGDKPPRYPNTRPMLDKYKDETDSNNKIFPGQRVQRLTPEEREKHRVYLDGKGDMRQASDGKRYDTSGGTAVHQDGRAIFVMDKNGNTYASKYEESGKFHHSTLGNGDPVAAAGEVKVTNGKVNFANSNSGHYQPQIDHMSNLNQEFKRHGVNPPIYDQSGGIKLNDPKNKLM